MDHGFIDIRTRLYCIGLGSDRVVLVPRVESGIGWLDTFSAISVHLSQLLRGSSSSLSLYSVDVRVKEITDVRRLRLIVGLLPFKKVSNPHHIQNVA